VSIDCRGTRQVKGHTAIPDVDSGGYGISCTNGVLRDLSLGCIMVSFEGQAIRGLLLTIPDNKVTSVRSAVSDKGAHFLEFRGCQCLLVSSSFLQRYGRSKW
jgi:hypothetical protein